MLGNIEICDSFFYISFPCLLTCPKLIFSVVLKSVIMTVRYWLTRCGRFVSHSLREFSVEIWHYNVALPLCHCPLVSQPQHSRQIWGSGSHNWLLLKSSWEQKSRVSFWAKYPIPRAFILRILNIKRLPDPCTPPVLPLYSPCTHPVLIHCVLVSPIPQYPL